jgi:hypothetical protein
MQLKKADVTSTITEATDILGTVGAILGELAPEAEVPIELVVKIAQEFGKLIGVALSGYNAASDTPITLDSILALKADTTPLSTPTE